MKIFLLTKKRLKSGDEWEVYSGFVIAARSMKIAREMAAKKSNEKIWNSSSRVECKCIAEESKVEGIILSNFVS